MKQEGVVAAAKAGGGPGLLPLALAGTPIVFVSYAIALALARHLPLPIVLAGSAANAIPIVLFGLAAYRAVGLLLVGRRPAVQLAGHLLLGAAYALVTYWLLLVLLGIVDSASLVQFNVQPFAGGASTWQLLQNATTYGIIAALAYIGPANAPVTVVFDGDDAGQAGGLTRYFVRSGDDIHPVDVDGIVSISGADDYAEVTTLEGTHLVRITLAEFEKALDPRRFIRIHRSAIVNVDRIARAEPAGGGRILLHMENGETIAASRAGSKLLKDRVL